MADKEPVKWRVRAQRLSKNSIGWTIALMWAPIVLIGSIAGRAVGLYLWCADTISKKEPTVEQRRQQVLDLPGYRMDGDKLMHGGLEVAQDADTLRKIIDRQGRPYDEMG